MNATPDHLRRDNADLLKGLNAAQAEAVALDASHLRILAGAGSGKTRVLTHRIAFHSHGGTIDPRSVLAVTFTRKAAQELRTRLSHLGLRDAITAGTFHAIAFAQLRSRWAERGIRPPELLERKAAFVGRLIRSRDLSKTLDTIAEIEWAAARNISPDAYAQAAAQQRRDTPMGAYTTMAQVLSDYAAAKTKRRVIDFDDVLRLAARDLRSDPTYAEARRWRHRHLFVDEFQDVNPLQFDLLRAWLGPESTLCVVGDPNQAIYAWNGADSTFLNGFERWFDSAQTVRLSENYRSSPQILAVANQLLEHGQMGASALRANRPDGDVPTVVAHANDHDEGVAIARAIRDARTPGSRWASHAVLVRTHAQTASIAEALTAAGIAHRASMGADFLRQPEISQALTDLRRSISVEAFVADLDRHLGLQAPGAEDDQAADEDEPGERFDFDGTPIPSSDPTPSVPATEQLSARRVANLTELSRLAHDYLMLDGLSTPAGFVDWLTVSVGGDATTPSGDGVDIVTFHAAKGLEWPSVHIAGCETGLTPIHHASSPESIAEERRLFYVAITRAERSLTFHWCKSRTFGPKTVRRERSEYIDSVETIMDFLNGVERVVPRRKSSVGSVPKPKALRPEPNSAASAELLAALKKWRLGAARAADVPAFVVFADRVLIDIANARPRSTAELLNISGIGSTKADRFGAALLAIVAEHAAP